MNAKVRNPGAALPAGAALVILCLGCWVPGCGGGGGGGGTGTSTPPAQLVTTGVVIGSYFRNARVCLDANANAACDANELSTVTGADGRFSLAATGSPVVAEIGTDAVQYDPDTGAASPVSGRIVLRAAREAPGVVSLHSTSVLAEMETNGLAYADALQKVASSLGVPPARLVADFNAETDPSVKGILKPASAEGLKRIQLALAAAKGGEDTRRLLAGATGTLDRIATVVVIYLENRSFDHLYGLFPGANGIEKALATGTGVTQLDRNGATPLASLPPVWTAGAAGASAWAFVSALPNKPFRIDSPPGGAAGMGTSSVIPDLVHRFYVNQMQINGGRNDLFAAWTDAGGLTMGHYDGSPMRLWKLAQQYVLADNFFQAAFGGSFLNHFWLVCACSPVWQGPPGSRISAVDASGARLLLAENSPPSAMGGVPVFAADFNVSAKMADGNYYAVNTTQPPYQPSGTAPSPRGDQRLADSAGNGSDAAIPLPPQTLRTVGDTLSAKNVGWRWYAGGYYQAQADRAAIYNGTVPNFQPHHQPFNYFSRFDPATTAGAAERAAHFRDYADLLNDIGAGTLPPVAFYKPQGNLNQHPGYADVASGDAHVADLVAKLQAGPQWKNMLVIVTYDENGGLWDHAPPPRADAWGPGTRVPAIILSPFAKKGYVDSVPYDTTSVIRFLTRRFGLDPLPGARRDMGDLSNALDLIP